MANFAICMRMFSRISRIIISAAAAIVAVSCATPRQINYLQDMNQESQIELENKFEARIVPYDELSIYVTCYDSELARPFNLYSNNYGGSGYNGSHGTGRHNYLVDVNGNIQFPVLGEIHVAGLTRLQLQDHIVGLLKSGHYIDDPFVMVRFDNFKIFFLGADGGKSINIENERCTFLEALALAGDLDALTRRDKIAVIREVDGKMTLRYLDPRDSKVFDDPYFMLKQNDMVITEAREARYLMRDFSYWVPFFGIASTAASFATLIIVTLQRTQTGK